MIVFDLAEISTPLYVDTSDKTMAAAKWVSKELRSECHAEHAGNNLKVYCLAGDPIKLLSFVLSFIASVSREEE
jgi:hypothetical protein